MYLRCNEAPRDLPAQVVASLATQQDMAAIQGYIETYCAEFGGRYRYNSSAPILRFAPRHKKSIQTALHAQLIRGKIDSKAKLLNL